MSSLTCSTVYSSTLPFPGWSFTSKQLFSFLGNVGLRNVHSALVKCFTTPELMRWPGIEQIYGPHLKKTSVFSSPKLWEDLHTRVIEHVSVRYYHQRLPGLMTPVEYPHCFAILHSHHPRPVDISP